MAKLNHDDAIVVRCAMDMLNQDTENRSHSLPTSWGTRHVNADTVRFRLWSPDEDAIKLRIMGADRTMAKDEDGWHELVLDQVRAGTPYGYVLGNGMVVPDPAARAQTGDVHGLSMVVDARNYQWINTGWQTRPWEETVHYELHIGTFTPEGTFIAAIERLDHLRDLGITTIELMPVGQFGGRRGWGYDGVLIYAPHRPYGSPDDLRALVDAAHGKGMNVVLDVIYNHFGPDGNYLPLVAPDFFHPEHRTPWGDAIAYEKRPVRDFFIENALYWLEEFQFDGLRFDAIDHILDEQSQTHILVEMAQRIRAHFPGRRLHLTTEDNRNITSLHERGPDGELTLYTAEWNDDFHNVAHAIGTHESEGYYEDFNEKQWWKIARCLAEGFAYQGEPSRHDRQRPRGTSSAHLPPTAFVDFIQNHDQVGNRAFGERLIDLADRSMVETLLAMLLLSPHIPLLFMGEEFGETRPFSFFTDFDGELADKVREGRRNEFSKFEAFHGDADSLRQVPDPNAEGTFLASKLNWDCLQSEGGRHWMDLTKRLLTLRHERIVPLLYGVGGHSGQIVTADSGIVAVAWKLNGAVLHMTANLDDEPRPAPPMAGPALYASSDAAVAALIQGELPGHSIVVMTEGEHQSVQIR